MYALPYLLRASLVLAILTTAYGLLVRRETFLQANRWLLWLNVVATFLLPILPIPDWSWIPNQPAEAVAQIMPEMPPSPPQPIPKELLPQNPQLVEIANKGVANRPTTYLDWVWWGYLAGVSLLTIRLLIQLFSLWRLKVGGLPQRTHEGLTLLASDEITAPFSFFRTIFYNPTQHTPDEWAQVYIHERVHATQWHSIDMITAELMRIIFWFNPFAWWHQRLLQATLEFLTDRAVLDSGIEKKDYQMHLLRSTLSIDSQQFTNHFNKSLLKTRIAMMNKSKSPLWSLTKYGLFISTLWLCAAFTKPYQAKIIDKITNQFPSIVPAINTSKLTPIALENKLSKSKNRQEKFAKIVIADTALIAKVDTSTFMSNTKYIVYTPDHKLHYLITARTSFEDMVRIRQEFEKHGFGLEVLKWQMDSMGRYLQRISVVIRAIGFPRIVHRGNDTTYTPIEPIAGTIPITKHGAVVISNLKGNTVPQLKSLQSVAEIDKELAQFYRRWGIGQYEIMNKQSKHGIYSSPIYLFSAKNLTDRPNSKHAFYVVKNSENKRLIKIERSFRNAFFRLNDNPAFLEDIEALSPDMFSQAVKYEVPNPNKKQNDIYVFVYTKKDSKP